MDMLGYAVYAERWGWTPQQVDQLTLEQDNWLMPIAFAIDSEKDYRQEKARRTAERNAKANQSKPEKKILGGPA